MVVTGSSWQSVTLGQLIPTLDPDREGSAAQRLTCEIGRIGDAIDTNLKKVTNLTSSIGDTLNTVGELGDAIVVLQNQIEDLITNALNTGVFMHTLGLNPIFSLRSPQEIFDEVLRTFTPETIRLAGPDGQFGTEDDIVTDTDPNRPIFKGDGLSVIGGVLILISAPNIQEMLASIERLGTIFPVFRSAIESIGDEALETADIFDDEFLTPATQSIDQLTSVFSSLEQTNLLSTQPFDNLISDFTDNDAVSFDGFDTALFDKWFALRLTDLIPALDPTKDGPAKAIIDAERALVGGGASLLQQAKGLARGVQELTQAVNFLNSRLQKLAGNVQELVGAVSQTGMFVHTIGLDGTVTSSRQFTDAVRRALFDTTDENRPRAAGRMSAFFGLEIVFGAANPLGLKSQFKTIGSVFGGLSTDLEDVGDAAGAFRTLG
jgi:hypothetical protein